MSAAGLPGDDHSGRPLVRQAGYGRVLVLCPLGHLVQSVALEDWSGSPVEARCADPAYVVTCRGGVNDHPAVAS